MTTYCSNCGKPLQREYSSLGMCKKCIDENESLEYASTTDYNLCDFPFWENDITGGYDEDS